MEVLSILHYFFTLTFEHSFNPYAAGCLFGQYKMMQNTLKMSETLAHGYSS